MRRLQIYDAPEIISEEGFNNSFLKLYQIRKDKRMFNPIYKL